MLQVDGLSRIAILCYHRISDGSAGGFNGFLPNISADPREFERQMNKVVGAYTPIGIEQLVRWLDYGEELPRKPALVTFDDGYLDNAEIALPIMRKLGIRPLIFLATDYIDNDRAFIWDLVAYCFATSKLPSARLPLMGPVALGGLSTRNRLTSEWMEACKQEPSYRRSDLLEELAEATGVPVSWATLPWKGCLSWDLVRQLAGDADFGGHTCSHPILSRMPIDEAAHEIRGCFEKLAIELGRPPLAFAYPNGSARDFRPEDEAAVISAGFRLGFSVGNGPVSRLRLRSRPGNVPRIYVGRPDVGVRFWLKLKGAGAAVGPIRQVFRRGLSPSRFLSPH